MGKKDNAKKARKEITETKRVSEKPKKTVLEIPEKSKVPEEMPELEAPQMREIVIQTDGTSIRITKNESSGNLELLAILQALMGSLTSPK